MSIVAYILGRLGQMVFVVLGVTLIAFLTIQLVPGDPVRIMLHGRATDEVVAAAHAKLGLDQPLPVQFVRFVWNAAARRSGHIDHPEGAGHRHRRRAARGLHLPAGVQRPHRRRAGAAAGAARRRQPEPAHRSRHTHRRHDRLRHAAVLDGSAADAAVRPDARPPAHLGVRQGLSRPYRASDPAVSDHRPVPRADARAVAARRHAGGPDRRLHRGGPLQGAERAAHPRQARPAQRPHPDHHRAGRQHRLAPERRRHRRVRLLPSGPGLASRARGRLSGTTPSSRVSRWCSR